MTSEREYVVLARDIDPSVSDQIRRRSAGEDAELAGLILEPQPVRLYPQPGGGPHTTLAAHLLGFVNRRGSRPVRRRAVLPGRPGGHRHGRRGPDGRVGNAVPDTSTVLEPGYAGPGHHADHRRLASRSRSSRSCCRRGSPTARSASRRSSWTRTPARSSPYASYPSYDANDYQAIAAEDPGRFVDPIVSTVYEPGSVFKMMTATAALGDGVVKTKTKINDSGTLRARRRARQGRRRRPQGDGLDDVRGRHRLLAQRRRREGRDRARQDHDRQAVDAAVRDVAQARLRRSRPASTSPTRSAGIVRDPAHQPWRQIDLANGAFGQGVAVTPIQLAQAYAAMVNGGVARPAAGRAGDRRPGDRSPSARAG